MKKFSRFRVACVVAASFLQAGCNLFGTGASSDRSPESTSSAEVSLPNLCVSNWDYNSVTVYAKTQSGDVAPIRTIFGPTTQLYAPGQLSFDPVTSNLVVPNNGSNALLVFSSTATGDAAPLRNLTLPQGQLVGTAVDWVHRELYVMLINYESTRGGIEVYDLDAIVNATDNQLPSALRVIAGDQVSLGWGTQLVVDFAHDEIIVASYGGDGSVLVFPRTANGNSAPSRRIVGPDTKLSSVGGVYYDSTNDEIFANERNGGIRVFPRTADGNATPLRVIEGANTSMGTEAGPLLLDSETNLIHLVDYDNSAINTYQRTDNGDVAPLQVLSGINSGLSGPYGLTFCQ